MDKKRAPLDQDQDQNPDQGPISRPEPGVPTDPEAKKEAHPTEVLPSGPLAVEPEETGTSRTPKTSGTNKPDTKSHKSAS